MNIEGLIGGSLTSESNAASKEEEIEITEEFEESDKHSKFKSPKKVKPHHAKKVVDPTTLVNQLLSIDDVKATVEELIEFDGDSWICKTCGKKCSMKPDMRKHVEIHIEGLSYECQLCGQTFRTRTNLNNHKTKSHKNK